jgi:hypothetical protein
MKKENLAEFMHRKRNELGWHVSLTSEELDKCMAQWATEYYKNIDGTKVEIIAGHILVTK